MSDIDDYNAEHLEEERIPRAVAEERERCAKLVPTNWLDPLLTGPGATKLPLDERGVEKLLLGVQKRIREIVRD